MLLYGSDPNRHYCWTRVSCLKCEGEGRPRPRCNLRHTYSSISICSYRHSAAQNVLWSAARRYLERETRCCAFHGQVPPSFILLKRRQSCSQLMSQKHSASRTRTVWTDRNLQVRRKNMHFNFCSLSSSFRDRTLLVGFRKEAATER